MRMCQSVIFLWEVNPESDADLTLQYTLKLTDNERDFMGNVIKNTLKTIDTPGKHSVEITESFTKILISRA
jgi:hypothetical protein